MVSKFVSDILQYKNKVYDRLDKTFNIIDSFLIDNYTNVIKEGIRNYEANQMIVLYEDNIKDLKKLIENEFPNIPVTDEDLGVFIENYSAKTNNIVRMSYDDQLYKPGEQIVLSVNLRRY